MGDANRTTVSAPCTGSGGAAHRARVGAATLVVALAATLGVAPAVAVGPPPPSYPERYDAPSSAAERDGRCEAYRNRVERSGQTLKDEGVLSRWNFIRARHRKAERYLKEHCGEANSRGLALSHRAARRSGMPDLAHPDRTLPPTPGHDDHH